MSKIIIFDFDGVLADSFTPLSLFLSKKRKLSPTKSAVKIIEYSLKNKHSWIKEKVRKLYFNSFTQFVSEYFNKNQVSGLNEFVFHQLKNPEFARFKKIILTSSCESYCEAILGPHKSLFYEIIGFDMVKNKTAGIKLIAQKYGISMDEILVITDTIGDILEFQKLIPKKNIFAASWGFTPIPLLRQVLPHNQILTEIEKIIENVRKF